MLLFQGIHIVLGLPLWGMPVLKSGPVLILTAEDSREMLLARTRAICLGLRLSNDETRRVAEGLLICDVSGGSFRLTEVDRDVVRPADNALANLIGACRAISPALLIVDPAVSFGVGESRVNDAEQGLVQAGRRLVREVGCCVLYVHHSGKANARDKALDQYAGRGGSAFADGARMVHVLQNLTAAEWLAATGTELQPGQSGLTLARPKMSYSPPQPNILIRRTGFIFEHVELRTTGKAAKTEANADAVWAFLKSEHDAGRRHSRNTLEASPTGLARAELRAALGWLEAASRVEVRDIPNAGQRGARQYLHPLASPATNNEAAIGDPPISPEVGGQAASPLPIGIAPPANRAEGLLPPPSLASPSDDGEAAASLANRDGDTADD